jgi:two-component system chemotaxis response regulator CheY
MNKKKNINYRDLKVLIVDDAYAIRFIVSSMLENIGVQIIDEAENGSEAYKMATEKSKKDEGYDLIISDWNMPMHCGLTLLKNVRSSDILQKTPFLLLTAESEDERIEEAIKYGVSHYSTKPFSCDMLIEAVEKALNAKINN